MNKIGIAGYGKMGRDIFNQCLRQPDISDITVYCRHDYESYTEKMRKEISKSLKRKKITKEQFDAKAENIRFTDSLEDLQDCDIIIESISENLAEKKKLFRQLYYIARPDCLLTTNTSSLRITDIFANCRNPERCMGLHFFYPVQFTSFVELNVLTKSGDEQIEAAQEFVRSLGKRGIVFSGRYHAYLNQLINAVISRGIMLCDEHNIGIRQCQEIFSEIFPMHGIFGMIESIGLNLLTINKVENGCTRLESITNYGLTKMKKWLDDGCSGEPNHFFETLDDLPRRIISDDETKEILLDIVNFIMIESRIASEEYGGDLTLMREAIANTLGLSESI